MCRYIFFLAAISGLSWAEPVKICLGSHNDWAPYTYAKSGTDADSTKITGAAFDLVSTLLSNAGFDYSITLIPWARVQLELKVFDERRNCELTWDASYSGERAEVFYYSAPIYHTNLGVFYSKKRFPETPNIESFAHSTFCGVVGFNYAPFQLSVDFQRTKSIKQALGMLSANRCDFFPSELEIISSNVAYSEIIAQKDIVSMPIEGLVKRFYIVVTKKSPRAEKIAAKLNHELIRLQESGQADRIFEKYIK